ncbi:MAG: EAL domain-containing protein [Phycisphaerales bacterium]
MSANYKLVHSLRIRYIIALVLVAVLAVGAHFAMLHMVTQGEKWATIINVAGRQRMLSQKITKATEQRDIEQLAKALADFERAHAGLLQGDEGLGVPPTTDQGVIKAFQIMEPAYAGLTQSARAVIDAPASEAVLPMAVIESVRSYERTFLPQMHSIVGQYESLSRADNLATKKLHLGVVIATLIILLAEALFVFEPAARRLREQLGKVRRSEERYKLAVGGSQDAIWDWDLLTDELHYAPRWAEMFRDDRLLDAHDIEAWMRLVASSDLHALIDDLEQLRSGVIDTLDREVEMCTPDGTALFVLCRGASVRDHEGRVSRIAGSLANVTEQRLIRNQLRDMAERDGLTGLANRTYFHERLELTIARSLRSNSFDYALLSFDFDGFKAVNDALGHTAGDHLLISIGHRLQKIAPDNATVARLGGDEFAILLHTSDERVVSEMCDRFVEECAKPHVISEQPIVSTASIGFVLGSSRYEDAEASLRDADAAMYIAKRSGKSQARLFDESMHAEAVRRLTLEGRLRESEFGRDFELKLQPIISVESGQTAGFEVLLRWVGAGIEDVSPDQFVPIAEDTGVIVPLGQWILERSAHMLNEIDGHVGHEETTLHVNVSKRQLLHPSLVPLLTKLSTQFPSQRGRLILEVTETAVMDRRAGLVPRMKEIRELGFTLAMDDFGTGHSSLACLHQFPLDEVKIDRSFILNIERSREFTAIYHAIVSLADHLGLNVVAEGVETPGQLAQLQAMGCTYAQGYMFSRAMTFEQALAFLASDPHDTRAA